MSDFLDWEKYMEIKTMMVIITIHNELTKVKSHRHFERLTHISTQNLSNSSFKTLAVKWIINSIWLFFFQFISLPLCSCICCQFKLTPFLSHVLTSICLKFIFSWYQMKTKIFPHISVKFSFPKLYLILV